MCTTLTQKHRTSWWRNLDSLVTSVGADWIRWLSRALGKVLRFRVYLLFGTKVEPVCADLRDTFQIKGQLLSSLRDSCILIIRANLLCSTWAAPPVLTYAASVSIHAFDRCEGFGGKRETGCHGGPVTFSSVHHWSLPISSSVVRLSSSPLLLLPLFFLCCLSSNSIAI